MAEIKRWRIGWVQNITNTQRSCHYPHKIGTVSWNKDEKPSMPIFDSVAQLGEPTKPLWYDPPPRNFQDDQGNIVEHQTDIHLQDTPSTWWKWLQPPTDPADWSTARAYKAEQSDHFRAWIVAARGDEDANVVEWLRWIDWNATLKIDLNEVDPENPDPHPWNGMTYSIQEQGVIHGDLNEGQGGFKPDIQPKNFNNVLTQEINDRED